MASLEAAPNVLNTIDPDQRLRTEFLGTEFRSPLVVASGTLVEEYEQIQPYIDAGAGAVVPRTTRLVMERQVHPSPHLYQYGARSSVNMLNAEWTGADIDYWRPYLEDMKDSDQVIMAVSGRDIEGCIEVCKELDSYGFPYIELNVGCGVTNGVIGYITRDEEHIKRLIGGVKEAGVETPVGVKLGHSDFIVHLSDVAKQEGADAIVAINTLGPVLDFTIDNQGKPQRVLGVEGGRGGLSGAALFNTALTDVALISSEVGIPVVASGGVTTAERAAKMLFAGASLVQVYSYLHDRGVNAPQAMTGLTEATVDYLAKHNIGNVKDVEGAALSILGGTTELTPQVPVIDPEKCTGCDRCVPACLPEAFSVVEKDNKNGHIVNILGDLCVGCGMCVAVCPVEGAVSFPVKD